MILFFLFKIWEKKNEFELFFMNLNCLFLFNKRFLIYIMYIQIINVIITKLLLKGKNYSLFVIYIVYIV